MKYTQARKLVEAALDMAEIRRKKKVKAGPPPEDDAIFSSSGAKKVTTEARVPLPNLNRNPYFKPVPSTPIPPINPPLDTIKPQGRNPFAEPWFENPQSPPLRVPRLVDVAPAPVPILPVPDVLDVAPFNKSAAKSARQASRARASAKGTISAMASSGKLMPTPSVSAATIGENRIMGESHNIETLEKLPISRLKKLHKEYMGKGTKEAAREASVIKRIIASRMNEEKEEEKTEEPETTKSMIARLVAKRAKRLGQQVAADVKRDIDPKHDIDEATSTNDPNRGRTWRAKPKLPPGQDPYDMYTKGVIKPYGGKTQRRLSSLSPESRKRYYREIGMRSRAASRAGTTGRLYT